MFVPILARLNHSSKRRFLSSVVNQWFREDQEQERRIQEMILANSSAIHTPPPPHRDPPDLYKYPSPDEYQHPAVPLEQVLTDTFK